MTTPETSSTPEPKPATSGLAIGSLITGIASIVLCAGGALLGPIAAILGFIDRGKGGRSGAATGGIVTGIIGFIIGAGFIALVFAGVIFGGAAVDELENNLDELEQELEDNFPGGTFAPGE